MNDYDNLINKYEIEVIVVTKAFWKSSELPLCTFLMTKRLQLLSVIKDLKKIKNEASVFNP